MNPNQQQIDGLSLMPYSTGVVATPDGRENEPVGYKTIKDKDTRYVPYRDRLRYYGRIYAQEDNQGQSIIGHGISPALILFLLGSDARGTKQLPITRSR